MKASLVAILALLAGIADAQITTFNQVQHIETALNHLTVLDLGEPVIKVAAADRDAFQVNWQGNQVMIEPQKDDASTNLFIWTATRELTYELDPAGEVRKMDVLVRDLPPKSLQPAVAATGPTDAEIQKIASMVLTQTLLGTEQISASQSKSQSNRVSVHFLEAFRAKDQLYLRYEVTNGMPDPFRVTTPDVHIARPTQVPVSLVSLRDHQITPQTFATFKAQPGTNVPVTHAETKVEDLAPGQKAVGVISIRVSNGETPQIYRFNFGMDHGTAVVVEAVL